MRRPCPVYWGLLWESTPSITLKRLPNDGHSCNHAQLKHFTSRFFVFTYYHPSPQRREILSQASGAVFWVKNVLFVTIQFCRALNQCFGSCSWSRWSWQAGESGYKVCQFAAEFPRLWPFHSHRSRRDTSLKNLCFKCDVLPDTACVQKLWDYL